MYIIINQSISTNHLHKNDHLFSHLSTIVGCPVNNTEETAANK